MKKCTLFADISVYCTLTRELAGQMNGTQGDERLDAKIYIIISCKEQENNQKTFGQGILCSHQRDGSVQHNTIDFRTK